MQDYLGISVENFGPIRDGRVDLKPLTLFIGPNNSGKSYMALMAYALVQSISGRSYRPSRTALGWDRGAPLTFAELDGLEEEITQLVRRSKTDIRLDQFSAPVRESVRRLLEDRRTSAGLALAEALRDYFGSEDLDGLRRRDKIASTTTMRDPDFRAMGLFLSASAPR